MTGRKTARVWAGCLVVLLVPCSERAAAETRAEPEGAACVVGALPAVGTTRLQENAVSRAGKIPGLGSVKASIGWDNRKELTLVGEDFEVIRSFTPLTREVTVSIGGRGEEPLVVRFGGVDGTVVTRGVHVIRGTSSPDAIRGLLGGAAVAAFRERVGNYERRLIVENPIARIDDPHAYGFLLAGALISSLAGDPTAVGRARDLILQRIRGKVRAVRLSFRDCVTDYERYLLDIDQQRTHCLDAANDRDSWYARAGDRLGCEVEFISQALAGEGQFISCTAFGALV